MSNIIDFDKDTATEYDKGVRRTLPAYDALLKLSRTYLSANLKLDANLLIIGAGGGNELTTLGPVNLGWTFTAVDPSAEMLILAKTKAAHFELIERVNFIEGTIDDVDIDTRYDGATCMLVLHFISEKADKLHLLKLIRKRLITGAPFVIASMYGNQNEPAFEALFSLWRAHWLDSTKLTVSEMDDMEKSVRALSFISEEEMTQLLKDAGFGDITKFFQTNMFGGWICIAK